MFDDEIIKQDAEKLLKILLLRMGLLLATILLASYLRLDLAGYIVLVSLPLLIIQVWNDNRIVVPKLVTILLFVFIIVVVHSWAGYYGIVGLVLFWVLYMLYRLFRLRKSPQLAHGLDLIKNSRKYAREMVEEKNKEEPK